MQFRDRLQVPLRFVAIWRSPVDLPIAELHKHLRRDVASRSAGRPRHTDARALKAIDRRQRLGQIGEHLAPLAERLVGREGAPLVAGGDQLEQHAGLGLVLGDVGDVVFIAALERSALDKIATPPHPKLDKNRRRSLAPSGRARQARGRPRQGGHVGPRPRMCRHVHLASGATSWGARAAPSHCGAWSCDRTIYKEAAVIAPPTQSRDAVPIPEHGRPQPCMPFIPGFDVLFRQNRTWRQTAPNPVAMHPCRARMTQAMARRAPLPPLSYPNPCSAPPGVPAGLSRSAQSGRSVRSHDQNVNRPRDSTTPTRQLARSNCI